jgi:hypothetical protein
MEYYVWEVVQYGILCLGSILTSAVVFLFRSSCYIVYAEILNPCMRSLQSYCALHLLCLNTVMQKIFQVEFINDNPVERTVHVHAETECTVHKHF